LRRSELDPGTDYVSPADPVQMRLAAIMQDILRIDRIGSTDSFFELGGDSLQAIELFVRIERSFGAVLSPSTIIDHPTIAKLATLLAGKGSGTERVLVTLQPEGDGPPLFLIHEASGNLFSYHALVQRLGGARKIYGLIYPGQHQDPIPALDIPAMAAIYRNAIVAVASDGPYCLLGYSFGGSVAYEVARQLREQGRRVGAVILVDAGIRDGQLTGLQKAVRKLSRHLEQMSEQPPSAWFAYLWQALRKELDQMPLNPLARLQQEGKDRALPQRLRVQIMETLIAALAAYAPPPYDGDVKLLRCTQGIGARYARKQLGWASAVRGRIECCELPTHHYAALSEPTVALVAAHVSRWLAEIDKP